MARPILRRQRRPGTSLPATVPDQHYGFAAEIPGLRPGHPLLRLSVEWSDRAEGEGERLRLKAHIKTAVGEMIATAGTRSEAPALTQDAAPAPGGRVGALVRSLGDAVGRGLRQPAVQRLLEPLRPYELNTWFDIQVSTAPLDAGATALLPAPEQLARLGIAPSAAATAPVMESWATPGAHPSSFAQVSLLRLGKERLPAAARSLLGPRPFHLAAAVVNVVEPALRSTRKP